MLLSILIPSNAREHSLRVLLNSLAKLKAPDVEFIVAINPEAPTKLESEFDWVRFTYCEQGSNLARRKALSLAQGEWCWFIDDDCVLPEDFNSTQLRKHLEETDIDAFAGSYSPGSQLNTTSKAYFIISDCWQMLSLKLGFPAIIGGNLLVRRKSLDESFWPPNIKFGGAELVFNLKALEKNLRIKNVLDFTIIHNVKINDEKALIRKAKLQASGSFQIKDTSAEKYLSHPMITHALLNHPLYQEADLKEQIKLKVAFKVYRKAFSSSLNSNDVWKRRFKVGHLIKQRILIYRAMKKARLI